MGKKNELIFAKNIEALNQDFNKLKESMKDLQIAYNNLEIKSNSFEMRINELEVKADSDDRVIENLIPSTSIWF